MDRFASLGAFPGNERYEELIKRPVELYKRDNDMRSPFARDYTRILHSHAYSRLKHKTQVFFNIENDHICTRMEHVTHVASVSETIGKELGLNTELIKAIAIGHDLGHAPFGHQGEKVLNALRENYLGKSFWHEQNGLYLVDNIELLKNDQDISNNLNLTYAVRDGIISHCGELDKNGLHPREELLDLSEITSAGQYEPATWEGCVVKLADKIAYVGRDIEDAKSLHFLTDADKQELQELAGGVMNTTVIMFTLIKDICEQSSPEAGIRLSDPVSQRLNAIKEFNYKHIYTNERFFPYQKYTTLVIEELFNVLLKGYDVRKCCIRWDILLDMQTTYRKLGTQFVKWLAVFCDEAIVAPKVYEAYNQGRYQNFKVYGRMISREVYIQAILDFISGMTDRFAVEAFEELLKY